MLIARRLRILVMRAVKEFYRDGCGQLAASISYYVLFSIFPLLIVSAIVLGQFLSGPRLQSELVDAIVDYVPLDEVAAREQLNRSLEHVSSTTIEAEKGKHLRHSGARDAKFAREIGPRAHLAGGDSSLPLFRQDDWIALRARGLGRFLENQGRCGMVPGFG